MSIKEPLLEVVVNECKAYPTTKVMAVTTTQPRVRVRQRVAARRCCVANRCFFLIFIILIGSCIIFRPNSLQPSITSSDMYFTNGTISTDKTLDVWNPNYYSVEMKNPVLEQWYLSCDCDDVCGWELFGKYEYDGEIDIRSRTSKQITTTSTTVPTPGALSYYAKRCLGDNLFIKFTSTWKIGDRKWKWYGAQYRIDCS
jgi:hypothetical protein